jgi:hypothetical protein
VLLIICGFDKQISAFIGVGCSIDFGYCLSFGLRKRAAFACGRIIMVKI